jgi:hypothetical protein
MYCSNLQLYSITSSARPSNDSGTVTPSARAATSASISYCSSEPGFSHYQGTRWSRYDVVS